MFLAVCAVGLFFGLAVLFIWLADQIRPDPAYRHVRTGRASWYAGSGMVAASRFYRPGTWVRVTYRKASIVVQITSAGPAWRFVRLPWPRRRIVDLARTAFIWLENPRIGLIDVTVEPCDPPAS
jgi:rare lipoprotein A (peptidoglycan hydrolase)